MAVEKEEEMRMARGRIMGWTGAAGLALAAVAIAQPTGQATTQQQTAQQQQIPDAPRPQPLPTLNTITPVGPAVTAPAPLPSAPSEQEAPSKLASTPAAQTPAEEEVEVPLPGQGVQKFVIAGAGVNFVEIPFTVKDSKGQLVPGIPQREVRVYENGLRQQLKLFTVDPFPLSVALVIDQSVPFNVMTTVNNALGALQGAFTPYDEIAIFTYNNGVKAQDKGFNAAQSARLAAILDRAKGKGRDTDMAMGGPLSKGNYLNGHDVDVNTNGHPNRPTSFESAPKEFHTLNDAILAAATETTKAAKGRRRIVYVISDGKEYGSTAKEGQVIKYCQQNKVSVWATIVGDSAVKGLGFLDRIHLPLTMRDNVLPRYAAATGGQVDPEFFQKGIESSFAKITEEVRTQYTLGYNSSEPILDGKYRKVEVRVQRPGLTIISKEGYYPTAENVKPAAATPTATP